MMLPSAYWEESREISTAKSRFCSILNALVPTLKRDKQLLLQSSECSFQLEICEFIFTPTQILLTPQTRSCWAISVTVLRRTISDIAAFYGRKQEWNRIEGQVMNTFFPTSMCLKMQWAYVLENEPTQA